MFFNYYTALQLIVVGLLALAVLLIYAVISFAILHNFYDPNENLFCDTLWQCFVSVTREGLLDTLGAVSYVVVTISFSIFIQHSLCNN